MLLNYEKNFEFIANSIKDCTNIFNFIINSYDTSGSTKYKSIMQTKFGISQIAIDNNFIFNSDPVMQTFEKDNASNFIC